MRRLCRRLVKRSQEGAEEQELEKDEKEKEEMEEEIYSGTIVIQSIMADNTAFWYVLDIT